METLDTLEQGIFVSTSTQQGTNMTTNPNPQPREPATALETPGNLETYITDTDIGFLRLTSLTTGQVEHSEDGDTYSIGRGTIRKHLPQTSVYF